MAGLVVSLLGLVLAVIVVGGFIGFVGLALSVIGLRRSATLGRGRGAAIGGIALAVLAILVAGLSLAFIVIGLRGGDEIVQNGISTHSTNTEFPPQDDLESVECTASEGGGLGLAVIAIFNKSGGSSSYTITVEWDAGAGSPVTNTVSSSFLPDGETEELRLFDVSGSGDPGSCRVSQIERSGFDFLSR
ncbi:MAG: hypothetical protein ACI81L_002411 [Verrucomicrobiales bacterium]